MPDSSQNTGLPEDITTQLEELIFSGKKIQAIKLHREATGSDLREAKEFIDNYDSELRQKSPEKFTADGKPGCGAALLVILFLGTVSGYTIAQAIHLL